MNDQSGSSILQVENLNVFYGTFHAVSSVTFDVKSGEIFGLLGPNGAGKTSTLSAIEGLLKPQSGEIFVAGFNISKQPLHARANMGVQLQATSFQPELTITEIIKLYAGIYGVNLSSGKLNTILQDIKLEESASKKFGQLSGGQQQR
ncbi:MAG: ATP-binding cassette domain-containing protein, partial [Ginsengibacter sp.]